MSDRDDARYRDAIEIVLGPAVQDGEDHCTTIARILRERDEARRRCGEMVSGDTHLACPGCHNGYDGLAHRLWLFLDALGRETGTELLAGSSEPEEETRVTIIPLPGQYGVVIEQMGGPVLMMVCAEHGDVSTIWLHEDGMAFGDAIVGAVRLQRAEIRLAIAQEALDEIDGAYSDNDEGYRALAQVAREALRRMGGV